MRTAYMATSGQRMDEVYVEAAAHDFCVLPFAWLRARPLIWKMWAKTRRVRLVVHVPCCYMDLGWSGDFYDDWRKIAALQNGWLVDDVGKLIVRCGTTLLNLRRPDEAPHSPCVDFADALGCHLADLYGEVPFSAVFVDCVWDAISWTADEGAVWKDRITLDREWKSGTDLMLKIVRGKLLELSGKPFIVGNGYTTCPSLDCRCIEGFPQIGWKKNVIGAYGAAAHETRYVNDAWFIPHSANGKPGCGATDEDALATIALAASYYGGEPRLDGFGTVLVMNSMQDAKRLRLL